VERYSNPAVVHCKGTEGGQPDETNQWVRNLLVPCATLQRSSIWKRVRKIGLCARDAERLLQHAITSVGLLKNNQGCRPADARQGVFLVLLTKTLPQFTVVRDKCSARGA
jgi:hypothetical protein